VVAIQDKKFLSVAIKMALLPHKITTNAKSGHEYTPEKVSGYLACERADVPDH
jgi:hypothetical protein